MPPPSDPPQRLRLPTFPSTESIFTLSSSAAATPSSELEEDHLVYPAAFAQLTNSFLPSTTSYPRRTPSLFRSRSARYRTTSDLRTPLARPLRSTPSLLGTRSSSVARPRLDRRATPPRRLSYQDMTQLRQMLHRSPSLHATVVNISDEDITYTSGPHPFPAIPPGGLMTEEPPTYPTASEPPRPVSEGQFTGWLEPTLAPTPQPVSLSRARAVRRERRHATPTTLHWDHIPPSTSMPLPLPIPSSTSSSPLTPLSGFLGGSTPVVTTEPLSSSSVRSLPALLTPGAELAPVQSSPSRLGQGKHSALLCPPRMHSPTGLLRSLRPRSADPPSEHAQDGEPEQGKEPERGRRRERRVLSRSRSPTPASRRHRSGNLLENVMLSMGFASR